MAVLAAPAAEELDELSIDAMEEVLVDIWRLVDYWPSFRVASMRFLEVFMTSTLS